jgi:hypothetical protein
MAHKEDMPRFHPQRLKNLLQTNPLNVSQHLRALIGQYYHSIPLLLDVVDAENRTQQNLGALRIPAFVGQKIRAALRAP